MTKGTKSKGGRNGKQRNDLPAAEQEIHACF